MPKKKYILFFALLINSYSLFSQCFINNGADIVITSGTTMYIDGGGSGDYMNQSSGANHGEIDIDGTIILEGDWTNNATSGNVFVNRDGDGVVQFTSATAQSINGTATTIFEDLTINNSLAGSAVTLNVDTEVSDDLTLTDGIITTGANKVIHSSTTASKLTGGTNTEFINGNYRRHFTTNASTYTFPVGDGTATTNYKRADFVNNSLNLSGGTDYLDVSVASVSESSPEDDATFLGASRTCLGTELLEIHSGAEWTIVPSNSTVSSGNYGVRLYVANVGDGLTGATYDNKFTVVKRSTASTSFADYDPVVCASGVSIPAAGAAGRVWAGGAGYAQKTTLNSFSKFAIASGAVPLPVELIEFYVECNKVYWTTNAETNNDYFEIERSLDGKEFEFVGQVEGAGTTNTNTKYDLVLPNNGENYFYRLKQVDFDGEFTYSKTVQSNCEKGKNVLGGFDFYPNPVKTNLNVNIYSKTNKYGFLEITNLMGQTVLVEPVNVMEGTTSKILNLSDLAIGTYYISFVSEYDRSARQFIKIMD